MRAAAWMLSLAVAWPGDDAVAAPPVADELAREQRAIEQRLRMLSRFLPDAPEPEEGTRKLESLLGASGLKNHALEYRMRPVVETMTDAYVPVDVTVEGTYAQIDGFLEKLARLPRVISVESLRIAWSGGRLKGTGTLRLEFWPKALPVPRAPLRPRSEERLAGAPAEWLEAFRKSHDLYQAKVARIEQLRGSPKGFLRVLAAFDGVPVAVGELFFDGDVRIQGSRVVPGPDLRAALSRAGFVVMRLDARREGQCEVFEVRGRLAVSGSGPWTTDRTWMFEPAMGLCEGSRETASRRIPQATTLAQRDGTTVSFELVRSPSGGRPDLVLSTGALTGNGEGYRVLADGGRRYFGYTVKAEPVEEQRFRLEIGPLGAEAQDILGREYGEMLGDPVAIDYPEPQVVASGEALLLTLMENRKSGDTLGDVIRVTAPPAPSRPILQIVDGALHRNGDLLVRTGTARGPRPAFELEGVGRFTVSLDSFPEPGSIVGCVHATLKHEDVYWTISFLWGKDSYVWTSRDPVVLGADNIPTHLWMCLDRRATSTGWVPAR